MKLIAVLFTLALLVFTGSYFSFAGETVQEKAKEGGSDARRGVKQLVRDIKDETCEMVGGKIQCAAQKTKHKILKGTDKIEDAID